MNITTTMHALYVIKARFDYLAHQLHDQGYQMAAAELMREADKFGCQLTQLDSVFDDYQIDIAAAQHRPERHSERLVGIDLAKAESGLGR